MTEYWLISTPTEKNADESWRNLSTSVNKIKNSALFKFYIPSLKVGTLDSLLSDADNLSKLEMYLEGLLNRLGTGLGNILDLESNPTQLRELFLVQGESIHTALVTFKWDTAKFPTKQSIKSIADLAHKQALLIENDYKNKYQEYVTARAAFESMNKTDQGNLMTRNLHRVVTPNDFVLNSIYLQTVLVVVPKKLINEWLNMYERFDDFVVPRSSRIITEDPDYYLAGVTLFRKHLKNFIDAAKRCKFIVRDHEHDEAADRMKKEKLERFRERKNEMFHPLLKMLKHNFSEIYKNYIHIKAAKVFVESVLRYGLPADFRTAIIFVNKKYVRKMREVLHNLYKHLDSSAISEGDSKAPHLETAAAVGHNPADYYPYVAAKFNCDII